MTMSNWNKMQIKIRNKKYETKLLWNKNKISHVNLQYVLKINSTVLMEKIKNTSLTKFPFKITTVAQRCHSIVRMSNR